MRFFSTLARLLYDPAGAIDALRADRPLGHAVVFGALATVAYGALISGLVSDLGAILSLRGFDEGGAMILVHYLFRIPRLLLPLVFLSALYLPSALIVLGALVRGSSPGDVLRREYGTSLSVVLSLWTFSLMVWMPIALAFADVRNPGSQTLWMVCPGLLFAVPAVVNFARVEGAGYVRAAAAVTLASASAVLIQLAVWATVLLTSPLFLIIAIVVLRALWKDWSSTRDAKERLRQNLEAATLNPADASAHLNLGLIYHGKSELERAAEHYLRAIEIDPDEIDAYYQLGRIHRERGQLVEALSRFDTVVQIHPAHANSEVWREIGATYQAAGQFEDAIGAFERFLERRPSDAEALFRLATALDGLGRHDDATRRMNDVVEAVRTAPVYKYRLERRWLTEAEAFLKNR